MEINVTALVKNLVDTFVPLAGSRGVTLEHDPGNSPISVTTSLEAVLPSFTAFLIKMLYLLKAGHYCRVNAQLLTSHEATRLRLQLTTTKLYFNPNLLIPGLSKLLQLDNHLPDCSVVYADMVLDEPAPAPVPPEASAVPLATPLASRFLAESFQKRAEQFAGDRLALDKIRATTASRDSQFMTRVEQTIANHLDSQALDADLLGRETGLSRAQLFRRLKQLTGLSTANYIRSVRLHRACDLLQTTQLTIGEVAYRVGFTDLSYFTRSFTDSWGSNPSEWRKQKNMKQ